MVVDDSEPETPQLQDEVVVYEWIPWTRKRSSSKLEDDYAGRSSLKQWDSPPKKERVSFEEEWRVLAEEEERKKKKKHRQTREEYLEWQKWEGFWPSLDKEEDDIAPGLNDSFIGAKVTEDENKRVTVVDDPATEWQRGKPR